VPGHISPKELKRDRFVETVVQAEEYAFSHARNIWIAAGVLVVVFAAVFGWRFWSAQQAQKASVAFDGAMQNYVARIRTPGEPEEPGEVTFVVEKLKYQEARKKFDQVAKDYSLTQQGTMARYYSALCSIHLNETDKAMSDLRILTSSNNAEVASLANLQLADLAAQAGKTDDAVKILTQLIDHPTAVVPKARAQMNLADIYRKSKPAEAAKLYEQVKKDYPDTPLSEEADRRLTEMGPAS